MNTYKVALFDDVHVNPGNVCLKIILLSLPIDFIYHSELIICNLPSNNII